jgi:hypothetical protein
MTVYAFSLARQLFTSDNAMFKQLNFRRRTQAIAVLAGVGCFLLFLRWMSTSAEFLGVPPAHGYNFTPVNYNVLPEPTGPVIVVSTPKVVISTGEPELVDLGLPDKFKSGSRLQLEVEVDFAKDMEWGALLIIQFLAPFDRIEGRQSYGGVTRPWCRKYGPVATLEVDVPTRTGKYLVELHASSSEFETPTQIIGRGFILIE